MPEPTKTTTRTPTPTTSLRPLPPIVPVPTQSTTPPSESASPGATESVVYEVTGTGRAINITYVDTGSLLQTEFNVVLPWRKEVELPSPAEDSASLTIINVGRAGVLLRDGQRRPGAVEYRQRPDDLHRRPLARRNPVRRMYRRHHHHARWPAPAADHRCLPERRRTSR